MLCACIEGDLLGIKEDSAIEISKSICTDTKKKYLSAQSQSDHTQLFMIDHI